ncbi:type II secretion system F family protein [Litorivivens sp.]|uniref:type II secretion system F family protein n=1 Tax=Litorivivens sp. TaxID=2020868 RepID=UPI003563857F
MIDLILLFACLLFAGYAAYSFFSLRASRESAAETDLFLEEEKEQLAGASYKVSSVRQSLQTLNLRIEPLLLLGIVIVASVCVGLVFLEFFPESQTLAIISSLAVMVMVYFLLNDISRWLRYRFEQKLVDALDLIQAAVAGGVSPQRALTVAANTTRGAVSRELREVADRLSYGLPVERAVERMQYRYNSEGVRLFKQALMVKWESGTGFAPLLESISELLRERIKLRIQISAQLSGSRYAAIFTGALPYLLVPLFLWKQPDWFEPLKNSEQGSTYLLVAVLSQVFGYLWLRRLLRVEI